MLNVEAGEAIFSENRFYRYALSRVWDPSKPTLMFIGLNPSTADEKKLDPTMRRVVGFADREGYGGFWMGNLFAFRATDPMAMRLHPSPVGLSNDTWLMNMAGRCDLIVCGWGTHGPHLGRDRAVLQLLKSSGRPIKALKITAKGHPSHPLYLPSDSPLLDFPPVNKQETQVAR